MIVCSPEIDPLDASDPEASTAADEAETDVLDPRFTRLL